MMMMTRASSCTIVLLLVILVDHVNALRCNHHHPVAAASTSRTTQQYRCSEMDRPTAIHLHMNVVMRHTRSTHLSLVLPRYCTHSIDSSSSYSRKEMTLQAGVPGVCVCVCVCVCVSIHSLLHSVSTAPCELSFDDDDNDDDVL